MKYLLAAALCLAPCACVAPRPTDLQIATADYGEAPTNIEEPIKAHFSDTLYDPFSAHYRFGAPYKGWYYASVPTGSSEVRFGWNVDVQVNAKNRLGGYTGWTRYVASFRKGWLDEVTQVFDY